MLNSNDKNRIGKEAAQLSKQGMSRQEMYDKLVEEYHERITIAEIVENTPTLKAKQKWGGLNAILLTILIVIAIIDLVDLSFVGLAIDILFIYGVYNYKTKYYSWISVRAFVSVVSGTILLLSLNKEETGVFTLVLMGIVLLMILISLLLGIYLNNKICPDAEIIKEPYINENGENRLRAIHRFKD